MICANCKEKIEGLENIQTGIATYKVYLNSNGEAEYEEGKDFFEYDGGDNYYSCELCGHYITDNEDEAIRILQESGSHPTENAQKEVE